jgi:hypothetical protein
MAMLAEIFMLRLEATVRASKESITRSTSQFVPITLPATLSTQTLFQVFARPEPGTNGREKPN